MRINISFLKSKVARRIFVLFILCAVIPISGLTLTSYIQVSGQLKEQSMSQLYNSVKAHGMSVYERFLFLETNMNIVASVLRTRGVDKALDMEKTLGPQGIKRFKALGLLHHSGRVTPLYGQIDELPDFFRGNVERKAPGRTLVRYKENGDKPYNVFMAIDLFVEDPESDVLVGQVDMPYLWGVGYDNMLPPLTDLCIVDQFRKVLISSFDTTDDLLHKVLIKRDETTKNYFEYKADGSVFFVSYWPLFMKSGFNAPNVSIVLRRAKEDVLSPLADFKKIFPMVVLLAFWVVFFLSVFHIRKSLIPLEILKKATREIARNDFKNRVNVESGDEFEDLANSFNTMSRSLGRHFEALMTRSEIDRAILSSLNVKQIINRAIKHMYTFFECDAIGISLAVAKKPLTYHSYITTDISVRQLIEEYYDISEEDQAALLNATQYLQVNLLRESAGFAPPSVRENMSALIVLPLFFDNGMKGIISMGFKQDPGFKVEEMVQARQISDQVAVAFSNSSLVEELEKLNIGTLEALARTVDAKSAWTAGHSERVTQLSVKIAKVMGLPEKEVETLRRGAYLHDIGKIGIPLSILDKPGRLDDEEYAVIKEHPEIGARILEPIEAYADVLTTIAQHHERYDGTGYPRGLSGEEISLGARIMAVADVYDAVVSDRPYRHGLIEEKVIDMVKQESGAHFDPKVVKAFLIAVSS